MFRPSSVLSRGCPRPGLLGSCLVFLSLLCAAPAAQTPAPDANRQEAEALEKEIEALRKQVRDLRVKQGATMDPKALRARLLDRVPSYQSFQQTPAPPPVQPPPNVIQTGPTTQTAPPNTDLPPIDANKIGGRLLGDAEKVGLPAGTIFTVDGSPVTRPEFDDTVAYVKSYAKGRTDEQIKQGVMVELLRQHAVEAAMGAKLAQYKQRIMEARRKVVDEKKDFEAVAKEMTDDSKEAGGDLGYFGREGMVLPLAKTAFEAQSLGEVLGPITTSLGYHLVKVTGRSPGRERSEDKVRASHIMVLFDSRSAVMNIVARTDAGRVDLGFVDASYRDYAPAVFKK